ncbi:MAG TPA: hypothetical protein VKA04_00415, partial [Pseudodesulfovibrio sp.]|nr:hypothetical protein [Pseudodesulfovibrio sp.]
MNIRFMNGRRSAIDSRKLLSTISFPTFSPIIKHTPILSIGFYLYTLVARFRQLVCVQNGEVDQAG